MAYRNFIKNQLLHRYVSGILSKWAPSNGYFSLWKNTFEIIFCCISSEQSPRGFSKTGALRNFAKFTEKHLCQRPVFSCEFCEISKNTFFYRTHPVAASISWLKSIVQVVSGISTIKKLLRKTPQDSQVNTRSICVIRRCFVKKVFLKI